MREIKFRFWYQGGFVGTHMVYWPEEDINLNIYLKRNDSCMQYTGLKDKNGKEIYEGDILETGYGKIEISIPEIFRALPETEIQNDCEVIGNIYGNPELLK